MFYRAFFEPFFTTKEQGKGTGLGLATVFGIVKQHQGWISVVSEPGKGATFQIFLPLKAAAPTPNRKAAVIKPRGGTETILLVEDDNVLRGATRTLLERYGYKVWEASNGVQALKVWEEQREGVALLLTDLVMPAGVGGRDLAQKLRADKPNLKVVLTSGYSNEIAGRKVHFEADEYFLQKPLRPDDLLKTIRNCLDGQQV